MNRRGFLSLFGLAAAAPVLAAEKLLPVGPDAFTYEPGPALEGFLVPPCFVAEIYRVMPVAHFREGIGTPSASPETFVIEDDFDSASERDWVEEAAT